MTIDDLQQAIAKLSPNDRTRLRLWLAEFDAGMAAQTKPPEKTTEKLGRFAGRAFADIKKRLNEP